MTPFAVAIYRGLEVPGPLARPKGLQLWGHYAEAAEWRLSPQELVQAELRLRTGRAWQDEGAGLTLVMVAAGSAPGKFLHKMLAAIEEARDANFH